MDRTRGEAVFVPRASRQSRRVRIPRSPLGSRQRGPGGSGSLCRSARTPRPRAFRARTRASGDEPQAARDCDDRDHHRRPAARPIHTRHANQRGSARGVPVPASAGTSNPRTPEPEGPDVIPTSATREVLRTNRMMYIMSIVRSRLVLAAVVLATIRTPALAANPQAPAAAAARQSAGDPPPPVAPATVSRDEAGHATVRAIHLDQPLHLDGALDESVYQESPSISDFIQQVPREGAPATERTEA